MKAKLLTVSGVFTLVAILAAGVIAFGCDGTDSTSSGEGTVSSTSTSGQGAPETAGGTDSTSASANSQGGAQDYAEGEATEFQGVKLTPTKDQRNNALDGTKRINKDTYTLVVDGLVANPLSLSYGDLEAYTQHSWLMDLNCVEGWSFTAKWTGPSLLDVLEDAQVDPSAIIVIFHTEDVPNGYSSLDLDYVIDNEILLALKLNDLTLPAERGFPFQVVAKSKYGYKWAKWVNRIEISADEDFLGYWESRGYSNDAEVGGPAFD